RGDRGRLRRAARPRGGRGRGRDRPRRRAVLLRGRRRGPRRVRDERAHRRPQGARPRAARGGGRRRRPRLRAVHDPRRALLLPSPRPRRHGPSGGGRVAELIRGLDAGVVRANLERVREEIAGTGRDPGGVEVLAAVKYVALEELDVLAQEGVTVAGENRAQDLEAKAAAHPELTWDFIGHLQSRKVKQVL